MHKYGGTAIITGVNTRCNIADIRVRKNATPLVVITAYTAPIARLLDQYADILLVGDSLGMVVYGHSNTQNVTLEMMIAHARAVVAHSNKALVVVDMPVGTYGMKAEALTHCARVLQETGAQAVKLEGGQDTANVIAHLVEHDVPVMGHVGLLPQRVRSPEGYRYQGRTKDDANAIMADALAVEQAGAFAVVIEAVAEPLARAITAKVRIPTIGIGASPACDGQVLVVDDMLGLTAKPPSFVKTYANLATIVDAAAAQYAADVRTRRFPESKHCFRLKEP